MQSYKKNPTKQSDFGRYIINYGTNVVILPLFPYLSSINGEQIAPQRKLTP
jgi:hypothetical protein